MEHLVLPLAVRYAIAALARPDYHAVTMGETHYSRQRSGYCHY